ncbi:MAG: M14 family zinc carboxypeptidase [Rhodothermales bacterium]
MKRIAFLLLFVGLSSSAFAQLLSPRFQFDPGLTYNPGIPSPAGFLGYELGTEYTMHFQLVDYLEAVAAASDRVTMEEYGRTYEGRPLYTLTITSAANHSRLNEIRTANVRLAGGTALSDGNASEIIGSNPAVSWLSYNVHGNEPSSSEAAMQVVYRLAAATDAETQQILNDTVVIIDPCMNPDGRDRYVYWYKSSQAHMLATDPSDLEHDEIWPGGRTNHYWFDLNRDWAWLVHPESQGRIKRYNQWLPQIHVDYHEQGFNSNYFTMPGVPPRNLNLPDAYDEWAEVFGNANVEEFDKHQVNYATREAFDFFYPGYGSSYPSIMGAIGMLTEQGGHSRGGRAVDTDDGYVLTLRQRIFDHYTTSLASLRTVAERRSDLQQYFRDFFLPKSNESTTAAYILPNNEDDFTYDVVKLLMDHDVQVHRADADFSIGDARGYWSGEAERRSFDAGAFIVRTDQPKHVFINTLMQREMAIEDSVMYDMSSWSAPIAYNLDAAWTTSSPSVATTLLDAPPSRPAGLTNPDAQYGYVIDWQQANAPKALAALWRDGYRVRSLQEPSTIGGETFAAGALVVLNGRNYDHRARIAADMQRIAAATGVEIIGMDSGRASDGIDLASGSSEPLHQPKVALMVDSPFSSYTAGQLWYLFDRFTEFGISRIRTDALGSLDLNEYDVILMPGAFGLGSVFDTTGLERLDRWVRDGGTLIGTESSALFLTEGQSGLTTIEAAKAPTTDEDDKKKRPSLKPADVGPYSARADSSGLRRIPGAAFRARLDTSHPLAFGMPETLYSLKQNTSALEPSRGYQLVGYYDSDADNLVASGYASEENRTKLADKVFAGVEPMGRGQVVFLVDNTQYRMFWIGPARLVQNAVMLLPSL